MPKRIKVRALLILALVLVVLSFLAAGLPNLVFHPGQPFSLSDSPQLSGNQALGLGGGDAVLMAFRGLMAIVVLLLPFYILIHLFSPEGRQRLLADLILLAVFFFAISAASEYNRNAARLPPQIAEPMAPLEIPSSKGPIATFSANPSQGLVIAVTMGIALLILGIGTAIYWTYLKHRQPVSPPPIHRLANEAQTALDEIRAGGNLKNIILRCYAQMNEAVQQSYGIQRGVTITPREFEQILVEKGLPQVPVRNLTLLFEETRYGSKEAGEREERNAVSSLEAIVTACKTLKEVTSYE